MRRSLRRDRVRERLDAMKYNPFEVARKMGVERGFVNDLLIPRKKSINGDALLDLCRILECDPEYLTGDQDQPRRLRPSAERTASCRGVVETGVWREEAAQPTALDAIRVETDPRWPTEAQAAFVVKGPGADRLGIFETDVVVVVDPAVLVPSAGDVVVLRRRRGDLVQTGIRELTGNGEAVTASSAFPPDPVEVDGAEAAITGVVVKVVRTLARGRDAHA